mmetsp:Transcript_50448/g.153431  ORF Transcript_50448/g.153431 Transcript_50448/m.153431 type:complete len:254 (-) Transcript_50448:925-1686(-)
MCSVRSTELFSTWSSRNKPGTTPGATKEKAPAIIALWVSHPASAHLPKLKPVVQTNIHVGCDMARCPNSCPKMANTSSSVKLSVGVLGSSGSSSSSDIPRKSDAVCRASPVASSSGPAAGATRGPPGARPRKRVSNTATTRSPPMPAAKALLCKLTWDWCFMYISVISTPRSLAKFRKVCRNVLPSRLRTRAAGAAFESTSHPDLPPFAVVAYSRPLGSRITSVLSPFTNSRSAPDSRRDVRKCSPSDSLDSW